MGWRHWLDLVVPRACAACAEPSDGPLCDRCRAALPWIPTYLRCALCQGELERPGASSGVMRCAKCTAQPSPLLRCTAAVWLEGDVHAWIRRFKYPRRGLAGLDAQAGAVARDLARAAARRGALLRPDCVIPIPLHPSRLRSRGFNPAGLLASVIARDAGVGVRHDCLVRVRDTPRQTGMGRRARSENVAGAFAWQARQPVSPHRVWLVDDVVTTGATLRAAAEVLRGAGVREVFALCAARSPERGGGVESAL
ncbi:MAG: ComF family protein [Deltaproteobacteria bacterium]|nr:ComF family protein [Deltaproteobacteria bacterium]MBW2382319.1 ComF family protein [Deltaproteobacteria bacterium]